MKFFESIRNKNETIGEAEREKRTNIALACAIIVLISSLPLLTDFLLCGTKLSYQLIRIEALKNGLEQYGLHLWVKPEWINPSGLSFAHYYGDTFLYIPAVLNLMGLGIQASYRVFLILINIVTVLVAYKVFEKIFADKYVGVLGSALYSASVYRMFLLYGEAELGEVVALIFLPIVLYGCYLLYFDDSAKWSYLWIAVGLSGMLRSHILSVCITVLFAVILAFVCVGNYRKRRVWVQTGLTIAMFFAFDLNYLYTLFRYVSCGRYILNPFTGQAIQTNGLQMAQLFMCFYQAGGSHEFGTNGMNQAVPVGLGFPLLIGIVLFLYLIFVYRADYEKQIRYYGYKACAIGAIACYCSTLFFPWDSIGKMGNMSAAVVSAIWQPWHFLQVGLIAFSVLGCVVYIMLKQKAILYSKIYGVGLVMMTLLCSSYLTANMLFTYDFVRVYTSEEIPYGEIAGMGIQVEPMHNTWYLCSLLSIIAIVLNVFLYKKISSKRK